MTRELSPLPPLTQFVAHPAPAPQIELFAVIAITRGAVSIVARNKAAVAIFEFKRRMENSLSFERDGACRVRKSVQDDNWNLDR
jgi:hypothetical protein